MSLLTCSSRFLSKHFSFCSSIRKTHLLCILLWLVVLNSSFERLFCIQLFSLRARKQSLSCKQGYKKNAHQNTLKCTKLSLFQSFCWAKFEIYPHISFFAKLNFSYFQRLQGDAIRVRSKYTFRVTYCALADTAWVWAVRIFWVLTNDL